jgi:hypothetical protein
LDANHDFVSLGINLGKDRYTDPRLTISATNVGGLMGHLGDLNDPDETDPEGLSPLSGLLDHLQSIDAAVTLKKGLAPNVGAASPDGGFTPGGYQEPTHPAAQAGKNCTHGAMKYKSGVSKAGKPYSGYFCPAPFGTQQCKAVFDN